MMCASGHAYHVDICSSKHFNRQSCTTTRAHIMSATPQRANPTQFDSRSNIGRVGCCSTMPTFQALLTMACSSMTMSGCVVHHTNDISQLQGRWGRVLLDCYHGECSMVVKVEELIGELNFRSLLALAKEGEHEEDLVHRYGLLGASRSKDIEQSHWQRQERAFLDDCPMPHIVLAEFTTSGAHSKEDVQTYHCSQ